MCRPATLGLLLLAACGGAEKDSGPVRRPEGPPVSAATLGVFAEDLDAVIDDTLARALALPVEGRRVPATRGTGRTGSVRMAGVRLEERAPARRDLAFALDDFSVSDRLFVSGRLRWHELEGGAALFRAELRLFGEHGGRVSIRGQRRAGEPVGLEVVTGDETLLLGEAPPALLTWVSTIAGDGREGDEDGPAASARFRHPSGVAVAKDGTIYVADATAGTVRVLSTAGVVETLVRGLDEPRDLGLDGEESLVVTQDTALHDTEATLLRVLLAGPLRGTQIPIIGPYEVGCGRLYGSCDGRPPMASLPWVKGIDVTPGMILVAQWADSPSVRAITPDGYVMTLRESFGGDCGAEDVPGPRDVALGPHGEVWVLTEHAVRVVDGDRALRDLSGKQCEIGDELSERGPPEVTRLSYPQGIAFDGERHLYITSGHNILRVHTETGFSETVAGCYAHEPGLDCPEDFGFRDGPGETAQFENPDKLAFDPHGDLVVADRENHAIRLVRILYDPALDPEIERLEPPTLPRGADDVVTLWGANLATLQTVDLGRGVEVEVLEARNRSARLRVTVAADAAPGPRAPRVSTLLGDVEPADGVALQVLEGDPPGAEVETIAGTGDGVFDHVPLGPSVRSTFGFATGLHARAVDEVLVADPLEHRVRLIASKKGAAAEVMRVLSAFFGDEAYYSMVTNALGFTAYVLQRFGIDDAWKKQSEDELVGALGDALAEACKEVGQADCEWVSLPFAGVPGVPGSSDGHRLQATFLLPSDVTGDATAAWVVDAGNKALRLIHRTEKDEPANQMVSTPARLRSFPFAIAGGKSPVMVTIPAAAAVGKFTLGTKDKDAVFEEAFGGGETPRCGLFGSEPLGIPLGITQRSSDYVLADPMCRTLRSLGESSGELHDLRGEFHSWGLGLCADGPLPLAALGAPMDVAYAGGRLFVADAGCHSIREIKDVFGGADLREARDGLTKFITWQRRRIGADRADAMLARLAALDMSFIDMFRYHVVTIAGSPSGQPGYEDGTAARSRFRFPTSISAVYDSGDLFLFVADTGNHRIRRIRVQ